MSFTLLVASVLVWLLSTRQFAVWVRAAIWLVGSGLFVAAFVFAYGGIQNILPALVDRYDRIFQMPTNVLGEVMWGNRATVAGSTMRMLDAFFVIAGAMALLALLAFTPGQRVEKFTRALGVGALGAIVGGLIALAIVAIGFDDFHKRHVYVGVLDEREVHDGDSFRMGDGSFRLAGIDAPELNQTCLVDGSFENCGTAARDHLWLLVRDGLVICGRPDWLRTDVESIERPPGETFGRPMVQCRVRPSQGREFDLAERMARDGFAVLFRTSIYSDEVNEARRAHRQIWNACTLTPDVWRNQSAERLAFLERRILPAEDSERFGCEAASLAPNSDNPR